MDFVGKIKDILSTLGTCYAEFENKIFWGLPMMHAPRTAK